MDTVIRNKFDIKSFINNQKSKISLIIMLSKLILKVKKKYINSSNVNKYFGGMYNNRTIYIRTKICVQSKKGSLKFCLYTVKKNINCKTKFRFNIFNIVYNIYYSV